MRDSSIIITDKNRKVIATISTDGTSAIKEDFMMFEVFDDEGNFIDNEDGDIYLCDKIKESGGDDEHDGRSNS